MTLVHVRAGSAVLTCFVRLCHDVWTALCTAQFTYSIHRKHQQFVPRVRLQSHHWHPGSRKQQHVTKTWLQIWWHYTSKC